VPYKSDKQRKFFNANRQELESQGVSVTHWNEVSRGIDLPTRASTKEKVMKKQAAGPMGISPMSQQGSGMPNPGKPPVLPKPAPAARMGQSAGQLAAPATGMKSAQEAVIKMAAFIQYLGNKIPVGTKAADVGRNQAKVHQLHKLAFQLKRTGNLVTAVNLCYQDKSAAYRHQVVQGLVKGLLGKVKQAQQLKQAKASCGMSKHPSGSIEANTAPTPKSKVKTTGTTSMTTPMKAANVGAGLEQGARAASSALQGAATQAMDPRKQEMVHAILEALAVGGTAAMGATLGGTGGAIAGVERGNTAEGLGRGVIRGAATGAGAGLGSMGGVALARQFGQNDVAGSLLGAGLGAGAGYLGSGALLGKPQGGSRG